MGRILFAPLTGLEVQGTHVDSNMLVVDVRVSINLNALTIEQVASESARARARRSFHAHAHAHPADPCTCISLVQVVSKMQASHLQLITMLADEFRFAGAPLKSLAPLQSLKIDAEREQAAWFNVPHNFKQATEDALAAQTMVVRLLAEEKTWSDAGSRGASSRSSRRSSQRGSPTATPHSEDGAPPPLYIEELAEERRAEALQLNEALSERMVSTAAVCSRMGHYSEAVRLLRFSIKKVPLKLRRAGASVPAHGNLKRSRAIETLCNHNAMRASLCHCPCRTETMYQDVQRVHRRSHCAHTPPPLTPDN